MNILGRVLGGILVFVALAWMASIAQVFPFLRTNNQFAGQPAPTPISPTPGAQNSNVPANQRTAAAPLTTGRPGNGAIAQNPSATSPSPATSPVPAAPATTQPPAAEQPVVPAGW